MGRKEQRACESRNARIRNPRLEDGGKQTSSQSQKAICAQSQLSRSEIGSLNTSWRGQGPGKEEGSPTLSISGRVITHIFWAFLLLSPRAEETLPPSRSCSPLSASSDLCPRGRWPSQPGVLRSRRRIIRFPGSICLEVAPGPRAAERSLRGQVGSGAGGKRRGDRGEKLFIVQVPAQRWDLGFSLAGDSQAGKDSVAGTPGRQ